jgi:hypothetical protein
MCIHSKTLRPWLDSRQRRLMGGFNSNMSQGRGRFRIYYEPRKQADIGYIFVSFSFSNIYIYIFFFLFLWCLNPISGNGLPFCDRSQTHPTRYDSSARVINRMQRPLPYNTQHSKETNSTAPAGFEPAILANGRPHNHAIDRGATGTGIIVYYWRYFELINGT